MSPRFIAPFLAVLLICVSVLAAGDTDKTKASGNPYRSAKVGDFAVYKLFDPAGKLADLDIITKKTITAKDEKSVQLKITKTSKFGSKESDSTIDLTKPYDIPVLYPFIKQGKFAKTEEGTEKIKVAGKEHNANWIAGKYTGNTVGGREATLEIKIWFSKDAGLDGLLRIRHGPKDGDITTELVESGSAK